MSYQKATVNCWFIMIFCFALGAGPASVASASEGTEKDTKAVPKIAEPGPISRAELLTGSDIPAQREFLLDPSISPCEDFYQHICKKVSSAFKLRDDRSEHTFSFDDSHERMLFAKRKFLKTLTLISPASERAQQLKNNFLACMDEKAGARDEKDFVSKEKDQVLKLHERAALAAFFADRILGVERSLVGFDSVPNQDEPMWQDLIVAAEGMTLPERSYYEKPEVMKDFEALVKKFFESVGMDRAAERAKWVVAFETGYAKATPLPAELRDRLTARDARSRAKFLTLYPELRLGALFKRVPARAILRDMIPESLKFMNQALVEVPVEALQSVYLFHDLHVYLDDAYPDFFKQKFEFNRVHLGGPETRPVREERCTTQVMNSFGKEIDAELLPILFPDFPENKAVALAESIRASIMNGLKSNTWLSVTAKKAALKKLQTAHLLLVKPRNDIEWDFNPPAVYSPDQPLKNTQLLKHNLIDKELGELKKPRDRTRWEMGPLTVNAYYSPMDNNFVLPIGILQYPFFDPNLPQLMNAGGIGAIIGHELGHAIDDQGAQYDFEGRVKNWMTEKDLKEFHKRGDVLVSRFEKIGHNGKLTLGENIGDHVGLTFAHAAVLNAQSPVAQQKEFFIQYARSWCEVIRPKYKEMLLKTDPHAIGEARVNEQVRQQPDFQKAFQCKAGDAMYLPAQDQVRIW